MIAKISETEYNGKTTPIVLVVGKAQRDAEDRSDVVGKEMWCVDLYTGKSKGEIIYVSLNAWGDRAIEVKGIVKDQYVLGIGQYSERVKGDKKYRSVNLEFVSVSGAAYSMPQMLTVDDDDSGGVLPF